MQSLIVFSHVRWDAMRERPQHVLTRLARTWRVLFVEEPVFGAGDPHAQLRAVHDGVTVLRPHTPLTAPGFHDDQIPLLTKLLGRAIAHERIAEYGTWFCTPMALPLLHRLDPRVVVYDCVDGVAAHDDAPRQFVQRENALLRVANVVFCSGPGLFAARRGRHANVVPCANGVDREHFAAGRDASAAHPEVRTLARPRLGFVGVVDERIDVALLHRVAFARPEWEICIVGPVAKAGAVPPPRAPNLHYFGARRYEEWPAFLAGWDVALLPFVRSDATRTLNPLQALEYMAAERPIVSTPIADVEALYRDVVRFGRSDDAFIAACEDALVEPAASRAQRVAAMRDIVRTTSWDDTALRMQQGIEAAAMHGLTDAARGMLDRATASNAPASATRDGAVPCMILGGGATGLSAAYHYGAGSVVIEREASVGGGCRSIEDTGFTFDRAGHIMFSDDPYVQDLYRLLLGDNVHWQQRDAWVYRDGGHTRCPVHEALQGLPPELLADGGIAAVVREDESSAHDPAVITMGPQARFGYPLRGGFQSLMDGFLPMLRGVVLLNADVLRVSPQLRSVTLKDGRRFRYDTLISTMPLPALIAAIGDEAPPDVQRAASELRHVSIRCVNLGVARPRVTDKHWIHFPDGTIFHRVFVQGNASPHCNPAGGFGLICEISYSQAKPLPVTGTALIERCMRDCIAVGLLDASDSLLTSNEVDIFHAYVIHDRDRAGRVTMIRDWLARFDIALAGRFGEWEHVSSDHAFVAGRKAAEAALRRGAVHAAPKRA
jgi:protoporphyrinogen oxidase